MKKRFAKSLIAAAAVMMMAAQTVYASGTADAGAPEAGTAGGMYTEESAAEEPSAVKEGLQDIYIPDAQDICITGMQDVDAGGADAVENSLLPETAAAQEELLRDPSAEESTEQEAEDAAAADAAVDTDMTENDAEGTGSGGVPDGGEETGGSAAPQEEEVREDAPVRDRNALREYILEKTYALEPYIDLTGYDTDYEEVKSIKREAANKEPALMYYTYSIEFRSAYADGKLVKIPLGLRSDSLDSQTRELIYRYREECDRIVAGMDSSWSDLEKVLYVHDWLCMNNTCVSHTKDDPMHAWEHSVIGPILKGNGVCQGYSYAFLALMNRCGIKAYVAVSYSLNHMWNLVELNGKLYHIDIMNDSKKDDGSPLGACSHTYFLKSGRWMKAKTSALNGASGKRIPARYGYLVGDRTYTQEDDIADDTSYDRFDSKTSAWGLEECPLQYYGGYWYSCSRRYYLPSESFALYRFKREGGGFRLEKDFLPEGTWDKDYRYAFIRDGGLYTLGSGGLVRIDMKTFRKETYPLPVQSGRIGSCYMDMEGPFHYRTVDGGVYTVKKEDLPKKAASVRTGWGRKDGRTVYYRNGKAVTGWQDINGFRYYFGNDGLQRTGWQDISGKKYYFFPASKGKVYKGTMARNWRDIDGKTYYFGSDGAMRTGWQTVNGYRYYFGNSGTQSLGFRVIGGKLYYFYLRTNGRHYKGTLAA